MVRFLRVSFPVTVVALFVAYGAMLQSAVRLSVGNGTLDFGHITISTEALVAEGPSYEGFGKDGSRFLVKAKTAEQDIQQSGPILLKTIDGTLFDASNSRTILTAPSGTYDTKSSVLQLFERINIVSENGMRAELTQATVETKDGRITSSQPVAVHMPSGTVLGNELEILQKDKIATFRKGVQSRLVPADGAAAKPGAAAAGPGLGLGGAQGGPVTIKSNELVVNDDKKIATFQGNVVAVQGEATLQTAVLQAFYEGGAKTPAATGVGPEAAAPPAAGAAPGRDSKVKRIIIPGSLTILQGNDRVNADSGDFNTESDTGVLIGNIVVTSGPEGKAVGDRVDLDNRNDTILMTGSVLVSQGKNLLRGRRLFVDRRSGRSVLTTPAEAGISRGRISARFFQANADAGKPAPAAAPKNADQDPMMMAMRSDPSQPIDIDADELDADDKAKTATFKGQVHAVQGDYTMTSAELVATYSGETGLGMGGAAPVPKPAAAPGQGAQIQKVFARQKVLVLSKEGQSASGDWAEFDTKANRVMLGGNVTLSQQGTVVTGQRALIDMTTGLFRMLPADTTVALDKKGQPIRSVEETAKALAPMAKQVGDAVKDAMPGAIVRSPSGRPALLLYPDQIREAGKKGVQAITPEAAGAKDAAKGAAKETAKSQTTPQTSGWSSTVKGGTQP